MSTEPLRVPAGESSLPANAYYRVTYTNGHGYETAYFETVDLKDSGAIVATDTDGLQHGWTPGANVHVKELKGENE